MSQPSSPTEAEAVIGRLVGDALSLEQVDPTVSFFEMGGTSAILLKIHQKIEQEFQRSIPMTELFEHPTVRSLAVYLMSTATAREAVAETSSADKESRILKGRDRQRLRLEQRRKV